MAGPLTAPKVEEVRAHDWQQVVRDAEHPSYTHISTKLSQKAAELEKEGDLTGASVYRFLNHIAFIHLDPDSRDQPLRPAWMSPTGRSAAIDDFDDEPRDIIEQ